MPGSSGIHLSNGKGRRMNQVFGEAPLADELDKCLGKAEEEAEATTPDDLRRGSTDMTSKVVVSMTDRHSLQAPRMVAPDSPGRPSIEQDHVVFSVELDGSFDLLDFAPDHVGGIPHEISRSGSTLDFSYPKPIGEEDYATIGDKYKKHVAFMRGVLDALRQQVEKYNSDLPGRIMPILKRTKQARKQEDDMANKLVQEVNKRRGRPD